jgi:hypothetical protein
MDHRASGEEKQPSSNSVNSEVEKVPAFLTPNVVERLPADPIPI